MKGRIDKLDVTNEIFCSGKDTVSDKKTNQRLEENVAEETI